MPSTSQASAVLTQTRWLAVSVVPPSSGRSSRRMSCSSAIILRKSKVSQLNPGQAWMGACFFAGASHR